MDDTVCKCKKMGSGKSLICLVVGTWCLFFTSGVKAQEATNTLLVGHSIGDVGIKYDYQVATFRFSMERDVGFLDGDGVRWFLQPQINRIRSVVDPRENVDESGWEFGVSPGLSFRIFRISDWLQFDLGAAVGPHFITASQVRQRKGFIFSDLLFSSLSVQCTEEIAIVGNVGFRHLSNARLRLPNAGINTFLGSVGIRWTVD